MALTPLYKADFVFGFLVCFVERDTPRHRVKQPATAPHQALQTGCSISPRTAHRGGRSRFPAKSTALCPATLPTACPLACSLGCGMRGGCQSPSSKEALTSPTQAQEVGCEKHTFIELLPVKMQSGNLNGIKRKKIILCRAAKTGIKPQWSPEQTTLMQNRERVEALG